MSDVRNSCGRAAGLCLAIAVLAGPAVAAEQWSMGGFQAVASPATVAAPATVNCVGGIVNDDSFFDGWLSLHSTPSQAFDAAMRFTGPGAGRRIDQVCVCCAAVKAPRAA